MPETYDLEEILLAKFGENHIANRDYAQYLINIGEKEGIYKGYDIASDLLEVVVNLRSGQHPPCWCSMADVDSDDDEHHWVCKEAWKAIQDAFDTWPAQTEHLQRFDSE